MVTLTLVATMKTRGTNKVDYLMGNNIRNLTNISRVTRRKYRTIIPGTTRKFQRFEDKSPSFDQVQNTPATETQSPQDLPSCKPLESHTTPVHVRNPLDLQKAVIDFMRKPLVSLDEPTRRYRRRRPLKCIQLKELPEVPVKNTANLERLQNVEEDRPVLCDQNKTTVEIRKKDLNTTRDLSSSSAQISSESFDVDQTIVKYEAGWNSSAKFST